MSDKSTIVTRTGLAIGALGLTYQAELLPGKTLAFETAVDATMGREELDGYMDDWIGACKRQAALEELPLVIQSLHANRMRLRDEEKKRAVLVANSQARERLRASERPHGTRRDRAEPLAESGDAANLAQADQMIANVRSAIRSAEARIPYLRALVAREEPPEPFPATETEEDEEGAAAAA